MIVYARADGERGDRHVLTFFPETVAMIRACGRPIRGAGAMRSRCEPMDVYCKVRLPASLLYLFTALKIATAAIVGAIIGEGPRILTDWGARSSTSTSIHHRPTARGSILVSALLGIAFRHHLGGRADRPGRGSAPADN
jgi:ABC-type nitrate/sulfonate/bicarbonate transport system permease component